MEAFAAVFQQLHARFCSAISPGKSLRAVDNDRHLLPESKLARTEFRIRENSGELLLIRNQTATRRGYFRI
jgi:hypothetical protein